MVVMKQLFWLFLFLLVGLIALIEILPADKTQSQEEINDANAHNVPLNEIHHVSMLASNARIECEQVAKTFSIYGAETVSSFFPEYTWQRVGNHIIISSDNVKFKNASNAERVVHIDCDVIIPSNINDYNKDQYEADSLARRNIKSLKLDGKRVVVRTF